MKHLKDSHKVGRILGLDERDIHNLMIDLGEKYVREVFTSNEAFAAAMLSTREFWIWWIEMVWQIQDRELMARLKMTPRGLRYIQDGNKYLISDRWIFYKNVHDPSQAPGQPDIEVADAALNILRDQKRKRESYA